MIIAKIIFLLTSALLLSLAQAQQLNFQAIPLENPQFMFRELRPFLDSLEKKTGFSINYKTSADYTETLENIARGEVDFALLSATTFLIAREKAGFRVLAELQFEQSPQYRSVIIVREDSGIDSLAQLKGKNFVFGSRLSTSNALLPKYMLLKAGLKLSALKSYRYLHHHNQVVLSVLNGRFDAGGVRKRVAEPYTKYGLKYLSVSQPLPNFCIAYHPRINKRTLEKLRRALMQLRIQNSYFDYFYPAGDHLYDSIKKIKKYVQENEN